MPESLSGKSGVNIGIAIQGDADYNPSHPDYGIALLMLAKLRQENGGTVEFPAGASSLVVTSDTVTADSRVFCFLGSQDPTAVLDSALAGDGSFTIRMSVPPTGDASVHFLIK